MKKQMFTGLKLCARALLVFLAWHSVFAQAQNSEITVTVSRDLVRFAAPGDVQEMRVEVFSPTSEKLFDSDFVAGQTQDWCLKDLQGQAVESGLYAYAVTIKDKDSALRTQRGNVIVGRVTMEREIELTSGGIKFPDNTVQTTAANGGAAANGGKEGVDSSNGATEAVATITGITAGEGLAGGGTDGNITLSVATGGIQSKMLAEASVTNTKLGPGAVGKQNLAVGAVGRIQLEGAAVNAEHIAHGVVTANHIARGAVNKEKIAAGAVGADQIEPRAVTKDKLGVGSVGADQILDGAVTTLKLERGAVRAEQIFDGAVTSSKLGRGAVGAEQIFDGSVTASKLGRGAVGAEQIFDGAVTTSKLGPGAVEKQNIAAGAVTGSHLAVPLALSGGRREASTISARNSEGTGVAGSGAVAGVAGYSESVTGVSGSSASGTGVVGTSASGIGVFGRNTNTTRGGNSPGVYGQGNAEDGVWAVSSNANGLYARGGNFGAYVVGAYTGVYGESSTGIGVYGKSSGVAVKAEGAGPTSTALEIKDGAIKVTGALATRPVFEFAAIGLCNGDKSAFIDHPLTNDNPLAKLFVTPVGATAQAVRVEYTTIYPPGNCPANRWILTHISGGGYSRYVTERFNIMVISP